MEEWEKEMAEAAKSPQFREDMRTVSQRGKSPFMKPNGEVDCDAYIEFVTEYNRFINHEPRPFKRIKDHNMLL